MRVRHPYLDAPFLALAHRGGARETTENTRTAFRYAVAQGYSYIETDIQVTRDGVAVLFHDDALDRTTDASGPISGLQWRDLQHVSTEAGTGEIMRLDEALEEFGTTRFNLDLKTDRAVGPFLEVVAAARAYQRVLAGAFNDRRLARVRRAVGPILATSAGPGEVAAAVATARTGRLLRGTGLAPLALQVPVRMGRVPVLSERLLDLTRARGQQVHVWTVDDPAEMEWLIDLGVQGIMTDSPAVLRSVLEKRGLWPS